MFVCRLRRNNCWKGAVSKLVFQLLLQKTKVSYLFIVDFSNRCKEEIKCVFLTKQQEKVSGALTLSLYSLQIKFENKWKSLSSATASTQSTLV